MYHICQVIDLLVQTVLEQLQEHTRMQMTPALTMLYHNNDSGPSPCSGRIQVGH